jgi:hypothetical protein
MKAVIIRYPIGQITDNIIKLIKISYSLYPEKLYLNRWKLKLEIIKI